MITDHLNNYTRGWFIGNFKPSILPTEQFEVALLTHQKNEYHAPHYHAIATEYNLVIEGIIQVNGKVFQQNDIFIFLPKETAHVEFLTDCKILCIKTPSIPTDKYKL